MLASYAIMGKLLGFVIQEMHILHSGLKTHLLKYQWNEDHCWLEHVQNYKKMLKQAEHIFDIFEYF